MHVWQVQIEQYDVEIIPPAKVQSFFAKIGRIDIETFARQHELNGPSSSRFVFDQEYAHI